jgi:hypothetical protein
MIVLDEVERLQLLLLKTGIDFNLETKGAVAVNYGTGWKFDYAAFYDEYVVKLADEAGQ